MNTTFLAPTNRCHQSSRVRAVGEIDQRNPEILLQGTASQSCPGSEFVASICGYVTDGNCRYNRHYSYKHSKRAAT